jgi:hypothetical protein
VSVVHTTTEFSKVPISFRKKEDNALFSNGEPAGVRTQDHLIKSQVLYRLSYRLTRLRCYRRARGWSTEGSAGTMQHRRMCYAARLARPLALLTAAAALSGCASLHPHHRNAMGREAMDAARAPFEDLGIVKDKIPPALAAVAEPYAIPPGGCEVLAYEVGELDRALGPDLDVPLAEAEASWRERGVDFAGRAARDTARDMATGWIPARGAVRWLTGAERASNALIDAVERGQVRRAFLKGLGASKGCAPPAAPRSDR